MKSESNLENQLVFKSNINSEIDASIIEVSKGKRKIKAK